MIYKNIEELVEDSEKIRLEEKERKLYLSDNATSINSFQKYWEEMKPRSAVQTIYALSNPGIYTLWKLPTHLHDSFNKTLSYATYILSRTQPEAAIATGLFYGVSEAIYGIKTKSGKHFMSGLVGLLTHMKNLPEEKIRNFSEKTLNYLKQYFNKD